MVTDSIYSFKNELGIYIEAFKFSLWISSRLKKHFFFRKCKLFLCIEGVDYKNGAVINSEFVFNLPHVESHFNWSLLSCSKSLVNDYKDGTLNESQSKEVESILRFLQINNPSILCKLIDKIEELSVYEGDFRWEEGIELPLRKPTVVWFRRLRKK